MKEMNQSGGGGGMFGMGNMPDMYNLVVKYKFTTSHYYSKY
jgi:hypothetical protein